MNGLLRNFLCAVCDVAASCRFFARPLAELITSQGRDILQSTVDLVQDMGVPGLEVGLGFSCALGTGSGAQETAVRIKLI